MITPWERAEGLGWSGPTDNAAFVWLARRGHPLTDLDLCHTDLNHIDVGMDLSGCSFLYNCENVKNSRLRGCVIYGATIVNQEVPLITDFDRLMDEAVHGEHFDMRGYHCGTAHCIAGWAVTLAGEAGLAIGSNTDIAAVAIWARNSRRPLPNFYTCNQIALEDWPK